jgi:hypothetical protein
VEEYDEGTWHGLVQLGALHYCVLYIPKQNRWLSITFSQRSKLDFSFRKNTDIVKIIRKIERKKINIEITYH